VLILLAPPSAVLLVASQKIIKNLIQLKKTKNCKLPQTLTASAAPPSAVILAAPPKIVKNKSKNFEPPSAPTATTDITVNYRPATDCSEHVALIMDNAW
jgi:hypothetical protein